MLDSATELINEGKKSLETLLREKAYEDVSSELDTRGIDINTVNDEDIEALVQAKVEDMHKGIKGFAYGSAFAILISSITGI